MFLPAATILSLKKKIQKSRLTCNFTYPTLSPTGNDGGAGVNPIPAYSFPSSSSSSPLPMEGGRDAGGMGKGKAGGGGGGRGLSWIQLPFREPIPEAMCCPSGTGRAGKGLRDRDSCEGKRGRTWLCRSREESSRAHRTKSRKASEGGPLPQMASAGSTSERRDQACCRGGGASAAWLVFQTDRISETEAASSLAEAEEVVFHAAWMSVEMEALHWVSPEPVLETESRRTDEVDGMSKVNAGMS